MVAPRKRLILHIGPHKTGTTALQFGLQSQCAWLGDQGYVYPTLGIVGHGHHGLQMLLAGKQPPSDDVTMGAFRALLRAHDWLILSSEDFCYLSPDALTSLRSMLDDVDIQVVFFVRTPVDLWPSHWQELVRHGRDMTLLDYLAAFCGWKPSHAANIMNPSVLAAKFANAFGESSLRIFSYDNLVASGADILDFFLSSVLGIKAAYPVDERRRINQSMAPQTVELLRCLNERCLQVAARNPKGFVLKAFLQQRADLEDGAPFQRFKAAFDEHAGTVALDSAQEFLRMRERQFMHRFADRIENKVSAERLCQQQRFQKTIRYGERYWTDRYDQTPYINQTLQSFTAMAG